MNNATLTCLFLAFMALPAHADSISQEEAREAVRKGEIRSLSEAVSKAESLYKGRVLDAELERSHGQYVYEVKLIGDDNWRRKIYFDAKTLDVLKEKRKPASGEDEQSAKERYR